MQLMFAIVGRSLKNSEESCSSGLIMKSDSSKFANLEADNIITASNEDLYSFPCNLTQHFDDLSTDDVVKEVILLKRLYHLVELSFLLELSIVVRTELIDEFFCILTCSRVLVETLLCEVVVLNNLFIMLTYQ